MPKKKPKINKKVLLRRLQIDFQRLQQRGIGFFIPNKIPKLLKYGINPDHPILKKGRIVLEGE